MDPFHLGLGEWELNPQRLAAFPTIQATQFQEVEHLCRQCPCASLPPWPPLASGISAMIANLAEGEGFEPSGAKSPTRLAVESLKPLGQPSSVSPSLSPSRHPVGIEPTRGGYLARVRGFEPQHPGDQSGTLHTLEHQFLRQCPIEQR